LRVYQEGITDVLSILNYDVYLLGFKGNPFPYLNRSHLFLKSSVYEGFPNVIIEAMSSGLPVISSDCAAGPREILSPSTDILSNASVLEYAEYGILTPVGDETNEQQYVSETSRAVIDVLTNEEKRSYYQQQSLARIKNYERKKIMDEWTDLIQ
jgi:N-acetylgalactosamine-N,N'-diacetylbacillosaminyl-diphospho-undecaprenol 4-alpha-N-acetylgalactosaminyltransferase